MNNRYQSVSAVSTRVHRSFRSTLLIALLVACTLYAVTARAEPASRLIRVGAYPNSPKIFYDEQGEVAGFWPDLLEHIAREENWTIRYVPGPWQDGLTRLVDGEIDLMPDVGYTEARSQLYTFSESTVLMSWSRLYVHKDNQRFRSIRDLDGWSVAALKGSINLEGPSGLREIVNSFNLSVTFLELDDYDAVFAAVESGEANAGISNRNFGNQNAVRYGIKKTPLIFQPANLKFAYPRNAAATPYLRSRIDFHLDQLQQDSGSIYYQLLAEYFEAEVAERKVEVWPAWLARGLKGAGLLVAMFAIAIIASRLQVKRKTRELDLRYEELKDGEQRYREIFNSPSDAIFIHDAGSGEILDVNRAMLDMYGLSYEEAMNSDVGQLSSGEHPYVQDSLPALIQDAIELGPQVFDWQAKKNNGQLFWVEVAIRFTEITGEGRIIAVVRDITDRMRMEDEVLKIKKLESVGVLAGGIAHDFNNILSAILGNLELSQQDVGPDHKATPLLQAAEEAVKRAAKLTKQLLTFSRGGAPVKEAASLRQIVRESADFILRGSPVASTYQCPDNLWLVHSDTGQISQVIQNLVLNASHAMPEGGALDIACTNLPAAEVDPVLGLDPGDYVLITIADHGIGIPDNIIDKIFDPYFSTKQEGSGLGLAITHSIISKHGGHIAVKSEPGCGTSFTIHLPAATGEGHTLAEEKPVPSVPFTGHVLVMDDDEDVREIMERILNRLGFEVTTVNDGHEAIARFEQNQAAGDSFDLVIMDLTIPGGMGGREAAQGILELAPEARILVASGYSDDKVMANFRDYGFVGTLAKPVVTADLRRIIRSVLKKAS